MSKRFSYTVTGQVQGVSFRYYTVKEAQKLGVSGWVQNASDGSVIGEVQGNESALQKFEEYLNKGPSSAEVSGVEKKDIATKDKESGFYQK